MNESNVVKVLAERKRRTKRREGCRRNEGNVRSGRGGFCDKLSVRKLSIKVSWSGKRFKISKSDSAFKCIYNEQILSRQTAFPN
ncbi:MAG: hypothetical protein ACKERG_00130 [Candidatus Hodgkinia cicadicola]